MIIKQHSKHKMWSLGWDLLVWDLLVWDYIEDLSMKLRSCQCFD